MYFKTYFLRVNGVNLVDQTICIAYPPFPPVTWRFFSITEDYLKNPSAVSVREAIVCGSRAHLEDDAVATRSFFRTILMYGFHAFVWIFAVRGVRDTQCGFKLFTREAARTCFQSLHVERWWVLATVKALLIFPASALLPLLLLLQGVWRWNIVHCSASENPHIWNSGELDRDWG